MLQTFLIACGATLFVNFILVAIGVGLLAILPDGSEIAQTGQPASEKQTPDAKAPNPLTLQRLGMQP
jgi:hypothetical protein